MKQMASIFVLLLLNSCKSGNGEKLSDGTKSASESSKLVLSASQVENTKLVTAISNTPEYKISESEFEVLKVDGILTSEEETELKNLQ